MKFHRKKTEELEKKEKRPIKEKALQVLKYIGTGAAVVAGGAAAVIIAGLASSADSNKEESNSDHDDHEFDPYYEPFADPDNPLYIETDSYGEIDWDDDEDPSDESYGAEDYYSSKPWTDE